MTKLWPLVWKSTYEMARRENYTLRDALREANNEVRKLRLLVIRLTPDNTKK